MVLKELVGASMGCFNFGAYHASFLLALCAVDATAKKRYPEEKHVGRRFKDFLRDCMLQLCPAENFWVAVDMPDDRSSLPLDANGMPDVPRVDDDFYRSAGKPRMVLMQGVLYHAFRCALSHEADLPDVQLLPPNTDGSVTTMVDAKVRISPDIIVRVLNAVIASPENGAIFGANAHTVGQSESVTDKAAKVENPK